MKKFTLFICLMIGLNQPLTANDNYLTNLALWAKPATNFITSYGLNILSFGCIGFLGHQIRNLKKESNKKDLQIETLEKSILKVKIDQAQQDEKTKQCFKIQQQQISNHAFSIIDLLHSQHITQRNIVVLNSRANQIHNLVLEKISHDNNGSVRDTIERAKQQQARIRADRLNKK